MLRLPRAALFVLLLFPLLMAALCRYFIESGPMNHARLWSFCLFFSILFTVFFVSWLYALIARVAPSRSIRDIAGIFLLLGVGYRVAVDWTSGEAMLATGKFPRPEDWPVLLPFHLAVTLGMLALLLLTGRWLVMRENGGKAVHGWWKTSLLLIAFPLGLWFIQPRVQRLPQAQPA